MLPSAARGEAGLDEAADLVAPPADISENTEQAELPGFVRTAMDGLNPGERGSSSSASGTTCPARI